MSPRARPTFLSAGVARAALAASALASSSAAASPASSTISIDWRAPTGCPSYGDVKSWLDAVLPPEVKQWTGGGRASVRLEKLPGAGFRARISVEVDGREPDASAERVLEGSACEELARAAVIVASVALTEAVSETTERQEDAAEAAPAPAGAPARDAVGPVRPPEDAPRPPARAELAAPPVVSLTGGVGSGFGSPAPRIDAALRRPLVGAMTLGVRVRALPAATVHSTAQEVQLFVIAGAPEACFVFRAGGAWRAGGCVRGEVGWIRAAGTGERGRKDGGLWAAAGALPFVEWGSDFRLIVAGDGDLRLRRPTFELDDGTPLHALPRAGFTGLVGVAVATP